MLEISQNLKEKIIAYARAGAPYEACGLLGGQLEGAGVAHHRVAQTFYPMTNVDQSPVHYTLDPTEQFKIMKQMREKGEELMGIFHSHVASPARPSAEDVRLAHYPGVSYVLVSLAEDPAPFKSYVIEGGNITEEIVRLIG